MSTLAALLQTPGAAIEADDDFDAVNALFREKGWSDGLPIVPPTPARVEQMLAYCDRHWHEPVGKMAPRYGEATPLRLGTRTCSLLTSPRTLPAPTFPLTSAGTVPAPTPISRGRGRGASITRRRAG